MTKPTAKTTQKLATIFTAAALAMPGLIPGASAQTIPAPDVYNVITTTGLRTGSFVLPEVVLPPPGPQRDALRNSWPRRDVEYKNYLLLLQNGAGEYAQCAGLYVSTKYSYYNYGLNNLNLDMLTNDRDALQILRRSNNRTDLPAYLGGCTAITAAEAGQITQNNIGVKIGFTVEAAFDIPLYGLETPEETVNKQDIIQNGRGVSLRWATGQCRAVGWMDSYASVQVGQQITLRALCPR